MSWFLFFAFFALCAASIVAFIRPKITQPNAANPSRIRAGAPFLGLAIVVMILFAVINQPPSSSVASATPDPTAPAAAPKAESAAQTDETEKGIGIALSPLKKYFTAQGYVFEPAQGEGAARSLVGQNKATTSVVMLMGPDDDIRVISLTYIMEKDNVNKAMEAVVSMAATLKMVYPKWEKPGDWLVDAIQKEGGMTKRDGAVIFYKPAPSLGGLALTIAAGE